MTEAKTTNKPTPQLQTLFALFEAANNRPATDIDQLARWLGTAQGHAAISRMFADQKMPRVVRVEKQRGASCKNA
jgi:hypothetical protein